MKKKLYALSGIFMIVLVVSGLWATKAINLSSAQQAIESPPTASLTTGLTMQQMAQGAEFIVIGKCVETRSQWVGRNLFTMATVSITESLKGAPAETVTVALPGGIDATRKFKVSMHYPGAPTMGAGEDVALFLVTAQDGIANAYEVMGFEQGKFSIAINEDNEKVVMRDMTRAKVQTTERVKRGNLEAITLPEFRAMVMNALR